MQIELIGVPFDGYGRPGNQASASAALRAAGLASAFGAHPVDDTGDLALPPPDPGRGPGTSLINETALLALADQLGERVAGAVAGSRFPVVHGGDCTTLLGVVPALPDAGLVVVDGHEDTMPLDVSEDGEAANCEVGLLLGVTGRLVTGPLRSRLGTLDAGALALLGPRDAGWRRRFNVRSVRGLGVHVRDVDEVAADPAGVARDAVAALPARWWLHVDLDVLDPVAFAAQGLPGVADEPGGLTVDQLTELLVTAVGRGGCAGLGLAIYDPDQDPDGHDARRVVDLVAAVAAALPG